MKIAGRRPLRGEPVGAQSLEELIVESAAAARPPERVTVSQAAARDRRLNNPGAYVGPWLNATTPYLVEPMDELQSLAFTGWAFAGPAQCGKTDMFPNWLGYSAVCDPADMTLVQTSQTTARDFSIRRIDRLHRHSPAIGAMLAKGRHGDNTFDKHYRNGMMLSLSWPAITELSGKPIPRLWLTDLDRMPEDIDGEGAPFDLARKRATTYGSHGMCAAESSPGFIIDNPKWIRTSKHQAPPTRGILSIYNRGDRRRWYWECCVCHGKFEPTFDLLEWPATDNHMEASENVTLPCPHGCGTVYRHDPHGDLPGKHGLNLGGRWVKDGMVWAKDGNMVGTPARSTIASFWLHGVAAAFSSWQTLVFNYLSAMDDYESNGSEEALKTTTNTDQGAPYLPRSTANDRAPETIKATARDHGFKTVPGAVRFLIATIDLQKNRFVVQVHGIALNGDVYVIDRFDIRKSQRLDEDEEHLWVNPGAYLEDWKLLVDEVMEKTYELGDGSGRRMAIRRTICDSGGSEGFTENAYSFVRWLRMGDPEGQNDEGVYTWKPGLAGHFMLLKGASEKQAPRVAVRFPDSQRKDRNAGARGEIPVLFINTNTLKDAVNHRLDRTDKGGRFFFPNWLDDNFYIELTVEVKDPVKGWLNPKNYRNESWDLLTYCLAALLTREIHLEYMDQDDPPSWAAPWDENDLVFDPDVDKKPGDAEKKPGHSLATLAGNLA